MRSESKNNPGPSTYGNLCRDKEALLNYNRNAGCSLAAVTCIHIGRLFQLTSDISYPNIPKFTFRLNTLTRETLV